MSGSAQRWTRGAIVSIALGKGFFTHAQMLESPEYAFFDSRTPSDLPLEEVIERPVLFRLWVMHYAHGKDRWVKLGSAPIASDLSQPVLRFNQDNLRPEIIRLTYDGCDGPLCTPEECAGLECAAVWDPEHVEDRLRDHYSGVPCKWLDSLQLVRPPIKIGAKAHAKRAGSRRK